jgi:flavin reductase (DIM6/NTAB) family NADH-FMN oxidoreductase RutF
VSFDEVVRIIACIAGIRLPEANLRGSGVEHWRQTVMPPSVFRRTGVDGPMTPSDAALDPYFERIDFPYHVVTVRTPDGDMSGCLAGFVTQCSINPPNFLVCVAKVNHTFEVADRSTAMGLHLLGKDQLELARIFGEETGDLVDKFAQCDWRLGATGAPLLVESAVALEGPILGHFSAGDHEAYLLRAERAVEGAHPGLLMYRDAPHLRPGHPL